MTEVFVTGQGITSGKPAGFTKTGCRHACSDQALPAPVWALISFGLWLALAFVALPTEAPGWAWMWTLALATFAAGKTATCCSDRSQVGTRPTLARRLAYLLAWPGMNRSCFFYGSRPIAPAPREWANALTKTLTGAAALALAIHLAGEVVARSPLQALAIGWLGMVGFVAALHFGLFHLLSCVYRAAGIDAEKIMDRPLLAQGVGEFWGRRWNRAFRDLAHRFVFDPVARRWGMTAALWSSFLVSGLIHELVITIPTGAGHGGPTAYFLLQALAISIERSRVGRRLGLAHAWRGRAFAAIALLAPLPLLFPTAFVASVVLPWLDACHRLVMAGWPGL